MSVAIAAGANIQSAIDAKPAGTIFQLSPGILSSDNLKLRAATNLLDIPAVEQFWTVQSY